MKSTDTTAEENKQDTTTTTTQNNEKPLVPERYITPKLVVINTSTLKKRAKKKRPKRIAPPPPTNIGFANSGYDGVSSTQTTPSHASSGQYHSLANSGSSSSSNLAIHRMNDQVLRSVPSSSQNSPQNSPYHTPPTNPSSPLRTVHKRKSTPPKPIRPPPPIPADAKKKRASNYSPHSTPNKTPKSRWDGPRQTSSPVHTVAPMRNGHSNSPSHASSSNAGYRPQRPKLPAEMLRRQASQSSDLPENKPVLAVKPVVQHEERTASPSPQKTPPHRPSQSPAKKKESPSKRVSKKQTSPFRTYTKTPTRTPLQKPSEFKKAMSGSDIGNRARNGEVNLEMRENPGRRKAPPSRPPPPKLSPGSKVQQRLVFLQDILFIILRTL